MDEVGTAPSTPAAAPAAPEHKPWGQWATSSEMIERFQELLKSPEKEFEADTFRTPVEEYAKRFVIREEIKPEQGEAVRPELDAVLMTPVINKNRTVERWKPVRLSSFAEVQKYNDSIGKYKRAIESFGDGGGGFDQSAFSGGGNQPFNDATGLIDREYVPLMWGPFYKQLYIYDYLYMHARAFEMVNHNAMAAAAIKILTQFTVGRGVSFMIKHPGAKAVWDEFWERNRMKQKLRQIARDLPWQGEIMLRYYDQPGGYLTAKVIDPSSCWEIVTDPEDMDKVYYYHFQWPTPYQIWVSGKIPVTKYVVAQIPPTNIQHLKINVSAQERRGRSSLMPAFPWFKRFNNYYDGTTIKAVLEANLVYILDVKGDQADVDAIASDPKLTILPPPGGVFVQNEALKLTPLSAQMTASARGGGIGSQIANIIAASLNLPGEYFNIEGGGGARATALVRTDPAVKTIENQQQVLRELQEDMYDRVIEAAINAGRISKTAARHEPEVRRAPADPEG